LVLNKSLVVYSSQKYQAHTNKIMNKLHIKITSYIHYIAQILIP